MNEPPDDLPPSERSIRSRKLDQERHPDIPHVDSLVLEEGPRSRKEIVHYPIHSRNSGEFKGHRIGFRTKYPSKGQWPNDPNKSFTLEGDEQIRNALQFILATCEGRIPNIGGDFIIVPTPGGSNVTGLQRVINDLSQGDKSTLLAKLLSQASQAPEMLEKLMEQVGRNPMLFTEAAAAITLAQYRRAFDQLGALIRKSASETAFQKLLADSPWMFGNEYSELLPRRKITRDEQADFLLHRTSDNYIELIEIKTPLEGNGLFLYDGSHDSYYARRELSQVIGQVQKYLEEADRSRDNIARRDNTDPLKIRAKIIIGCDGPQDQREAQREALRTYNAYLHRIEVLTFNGLWRIAERVLNSLERLIPTPEAPEEDIPF